MVDLLRANAPSNAQCIAAIDAVEDDVILFRCFNDASLPYEIFVGQVQRFAKVVAEGVPVHSAAQHEKAANGAQHALHVEASQVVRNAIRDFAHARGLTPPEDTDKFLVCMPGGGGISVQIEPSSGDVLLTSHLGPVLADDPTLRPLLELHMLGEATGGAFFAMDEPEGDLVLYRCVSAETLDGLELDRLLNRLGVATVDCAQRIGITLPRFD
ncbi:type III secretion system chaperone [Hydrogenophaga sp.]|uniref:type III secretion system chaperone n=1 Tax=Hydrogenophaga sp. TaxID=1904254 RepID=UPI00272758C8|nr:type III secretion system chaperone [Hydrogenophaga sp.]MDO9434129.1 type III secretion system chaperone [Hydrogenophaga sp.]